MHKKLIYVIQEHHASHLHWDLRLEFKSKLKSWAIPKIPSINKKRLAIQVEDHPIGYEKFEGIIPEGEYGAGKVKIWDSGYYEILERTEKLWKLKITGEKLKGIFILLKIKDKNWIFFRKKSL